MPDSLNIFQNLQSIWYSYQELQINNIQKKKLRGFESASELYRSGDRRRSAKLLPTLADRGCNVVSATSPSDRNFDFLYLEPLLLLPSSSSNCSRGWVDSVPEHMKRHDTETRLDTCNCPYNAAYLGDPTFLRKLRNIGELSNAPTQFYYMPILHSFSEVPSTVSC
jgi:hypothetical protein